MTGFRAFACILSGLVLLSVIQAGAAAGIKASATPRFPYLPKNQKSDDFQVLLRVEAPSEKPTTSPGAVAVVLDVDDDKIDYVKNAAGHVKKDREISIVVRSSAPGAGWVEVAALQDARAQGRVGDGEDLPVDDGLAAAYRYLPGKTGTVAGSIILVTDTGDAFRISYDNRDVPVHILGVGVESGAILPLHSTFVEKKGWTYSFVEAPKNDGTKDLASALAFLVAGLSEVVAPQKTRVTLGAKAQGVNVTRVQRGGIDIPLTDDKDAFDIDVLYAGEVKNFIVHLDVPLAFTPREKCEEKQQLLEYAVAGYAKKLYITRPQDTMYPLPIPMPMPTVVYHIVQFELLEIVYKLMVKHESTEQLAKDLVDAWGVLVNKHRFKVGWDLAFLQDEIDGIVYHLNNNDMSYIFSWWSGYQAQRPTILGSWENHLAVFVDRTIIKRWTNVVVSVNVNVEIDGNGRCPSATRCKAPENVFLKEGPQGTFILNPVYQNIDLNKLNTVLKELFQAGCSADEASADTPPQVN